MEKKAEVTVKPDCKLIIKEGSKITLKKGAKLNIQGETEIGPNVQIKLLKGSILNLNEANCKGGKEVKIIGVK